MPGEYNLINQIMDVPQSPPGTDGIGSLFSGFLSGYAQRQVAKERNAENEAIDVENSAFEGFGEPGGFLKQKTQGNWLTDISTAYLRAPGLKQEMADPFARLKELRIGAELQGTFLKNKADTLMLEATMADQKTMEGLMDSLAADPDYLSKVKTPPLFRTPQYQGVYRGMDMAHSRSLAAKAAQTNLGFFNKSLNQLSNFGDADSIADSTRISRMVEENGMPTPDGITEVTTAIGRAKQRQMKSAAQVELREESVGGKNYIIAQVPGSKAFQWKDTAELSPVDMINYRSAVRRRDKAVEDLSDPIKGLKKDSLQQIINDSNEEIKGILGNKPAEGAGGGQPSATPAIPKAQSKGDVENVLRQANEAIQQGKDPAIIRQRVIDMGIKPNF